MSGKKRKRRSFWEPDSEKLVAWLNDQSDLGTSLQLIIVDAIHKYGEGDVIKAHLNQRENPSYVDTSENQLSKPQALSQNKEFISDVSAEVDSDEDVTHADTVEQDYVNLDNTQKEENESFDVQEKEASSEHDPLAIMMNDIESKFNK